MRYICVLVGAIVVWEVVWVPPPPSPYGMVWWWWFCLNQPRGLVINR